jgi:hypothetical protein
MRLAERHATRQFRFTNSGLIRSVNSSGMPTGLPTSNAAPVAIDCRSHSKDDGAALQGPQSGCPSFIHAQNVGWSDCPRVKRHQAKK